MGVSKRLIGKYDLFTFFLIPGAAVLLASLDSWTGSNLSVLGSSGRNRLLFALWGFLAGIYYCGYILYLFHLGSYRNLAGKGLVFTAAAFLLTAVMIPYSPDKYPMKAQLHVLLAFLSLILFALGIVCFLRFLSSRNKMRYHWAWKLMWIFAACSLAILIKAGFINSFLEVFMVAGLCVYLRYLEWLLDEEAEHDEMTRNGIEDQ